MKPKYRQVGSRWRQAALSWMCLSGGRGRGAEMSKIPAQSLLSCCCWVTLGSITKHIKIEVPCQLSPCTGCCAAVFKSGCQYATIVIYRGGPYSNLESGRGRGRTRRTCFKEKVLGIILFCLDWEFHFVPYELVHTHIGLYTYFNLVCVCAHACRYRSSRATVCVRGQPAGVRGQPADIDPCLCILIETGPLCTCVSQAWWLMSFRRLFRLGCSSSHSGVPGLENWATTPDL